MYAKDSKELLPQLDRAGAGISPSRRWMGKYILFPSLRRCLTWDRTWMLYEKEGEKILQLANSLNRDELFERVLVPPLFGLEDNSRYYSVAMVLMHLLIVGEALVRRIPPLSRGIRPDDQVKIEDVKPYTEIPDDIVERFARFMQSYRRRLEKNLGDIHIDNTTPHPWFGELNPKGWSTLAMVHQIVHRRQIEAIVDRLKSRTPE